MPLVIREDGTLGEEGGQEATAAVKNKGGCQVGRDRPDRPTAVRVPPEFVGLDRFEARKKIIERLKTTALLEKVEQHQHSVRRCYRCDTVVEPRLSDQWFVKMKPLAEPVMRGYEQTEFTIVPDRWRATFENWMDNIRDWNISRQLWWGHRVPVFTCTKCKHQWADRVDPTACPKCGGAVVQDPDVLEPGSHRGSGRSRHSAGRRI